jgi:hypothetical protein
LTLLGVGPIRKSTLAMLTIVVADAWPSASPSNRVVATRSDLVLFRVRSIT